MARSSASLVVLLVLSALLIAVPLASAISCGQMTSLLIPCVPYGSGSGPLTPGCCNGVRTINGAAHTKADRQLACNCLKTVARSYPGIKPNIVLGIPGKCSVKIPYPISTNTDCSKVT